MRCPRCHRKLAPGATCPADGAAPIGESATQAIDPGAPPIVPGWDVHGLVAAGGQAAVWRAVAVADTDARERALKVAHVAGPDVVVRFAEEAAALASIGPPAVAELIDHGVLADRKPYLAMELVAGATMGTALEEAAGLLPIALVLAWARGVASALAAVHAAGWIHRDLKPENVVRDPDGRVRLLDLGLAQRGAGGDNLGAVGLVVGTPLYIAPEQLRGEVVDARADLYSLGAMLFEVATSRPPFVGDRAAIELGHLTFRAPRAATLRAIPRALDDVIAACLAKSPRDRPDGAAAVLAALDGAEAGPEVTSAPIAAAQARGMAALCAIEGAPGSVNLDTEARRRGGQVARQLPGRAVLAFLPDDGPAPLPAALATAHALAAAGARATVHVASLVVRRGKTGRAMLFGPALDRPADWLPAASVVDAARVILTADAARELDASEVAAIDGDRFYRVRDRDAADGATPGVDPSSAVPALIGRDAILDSARASAAAAFDDVVPAAWFALGGSGSGKSRMIGAIAALVAERHPDARVIRLDGHRSFGGDAAAIARDLLARLAAIGSTESMSARDPSLTVALRAAIDRVIGERPLAIVIDDAQWIDESLLDALATAVRTASGPLWIAGCAAETIAARKPAWLDGARVTLARLDPLDDGDARVLIRRLLSPVRRLPEALIARLAARTGGVPGVAAALARELRRAGAIRRHPGSEVWFLAADELDFLPPTPGVHWFVERRLAALGPGQAELARVASLLGPRFAAAELDAASRVAAAGVTVDPGIGSDALVAASVLMRDGADLRFRTDAEQDAIAQGLAPAVRLDVHRAVLEHLRGDPASSSERSARIAYHAARAGEPATAIAHLERLAADATMRHAPLEAVRWLTHALELSTAAAADEVRQRLLDARGRARRMLTHYEAARDDLRAARAIALARADAVAVVEMLVAEAAVCDFTEQLTESARLVEQALAIAAGGAHAAVELPALTRARLDQWTGVVRARQERLDEARAALTAAIDAGHALGDHETQIGSMLMLGGVLRRLGLVDDGLAVLDRAIELCERAGDHFHLAIALFNRINVWRRRGLAAPAEADAARAIEVANRAGLDQVELWGWYNLSELRWWHGDLDGAFAAAETSYRIGGQRFRDAPPVVGTMWYAVLLAAAGEVAAAGRVLDEVRAADVAANPGLALTRDATRLAVAGELGAAWEPLVELAARPGAEEDAVFVHWLRGRTARRTGDAALAAAAFAAAETAAAALGRAAPPTCWREASEASDQE